MDEIQACPQAIVALRYFKEKLPSLHIIGAGSLLDFALTKGKFSFPVGRVQFMHLYSLSFYEYALARGHKNKIDQLFSSSLTSPVDTLLHNDMMHLVREYFLIGGMPAAVSNFCQHFAYAEAHQAHKMLFSTYQVILFSNTLYFLQSQFFLF